LTQANKRRSLLHKRRKKKLRGKTEKFSVRRSASPNGGKGVRAERKTMEKKQKRSEQESARKRKPFNATVGQSGGGEEGPLAR